MMTDTKILSIVVHIVIGVALLAFYALIFLALVGLLRFIF